MAKLGFSDRKITHIPQNAQDLMCLLSELMVASINNEVEIENAKLALNAATRIVEVWQADTRMKALAVASSRAITKSGRWDTIDADPKLISGEIDEQEKEMA